MVEWKFVFFKLKINQLVNKLDGEEEFIEILECVLVN